MEYNLVRFTILVAVWVILIYILNTIRVKRGNKIFNYINVYIFIVVSIYSLLLMYRTNFFPNVFIDEYNGMYDSWSIGKYGLDSHLMKNPIYLQGHAGQGQSIFYAYFASYFMKIFGYQLFAFRIPMILLNISALLLLVYVLLSKFSNRVAVIGITIFTTAPYIFTLSRFGMDCNASIFLIFIGSLIFYLGILQKNKYYRIVELTLGMFFIGLTAYAYNVGWIYLPIYVIGILTTVIIRKKVKLKELIVPLLIMSIEIIPILIFAVRSNIPSLNHTVKILFWTSPELLVIRASASMISFNGNIINNIINNIYQGLLMYVKGNDGLSWNSVDNFGPYQMIVLPFFLYGLYIVFSKNKLEYSLVKVAIISCIPIVLVVTPNYNHWMFLHMPVLMLVLVGLVNIKNDDFYKIIIASYLILGCSFMYQYFNAQRNTGAEISGIEQVRKLKTENYRKVYFISNAHDFVDMMRLAVPVSPQKFQATKENPYSKEKVIFTEKYSNFERYNGQKLKNCMLILPMDQMKMHKNYKISYKVYLGTEYAVVIFK